MEALDSIPQSELKYRWARVRQCLEQDLPQAQGVMVMSRALIYWLSGHWGNGLFWLPREGEPVLMLRKGLDRAKLESPVQTIRSFRSPSQIPEILADQGQTVPSVAGADMGGISWTMGQLLARKLPDVSFVDAELVLSKARAVKSDWELSVIGLAGERHNRVLVQNMVQHIHPEMNEQDIARCLLQEMFAVGHQGQVRMHGLGEELYCGVVSAGDSGNYPTVSSGPVGYRGMHPAVPQMGYSGQIWSAGRPLILDTVFQLEGYHTDKTQVYFAGQQSQLPSKLKDAHSMCQEVYAWLLENLRPGAIPSELYAHCLDMVAQKGWGEGFMGLGENKVPFVGHGVGIFVDDWPVVASKFDAPLEEDMVLALEPKIGIPGLGMAGVENTCRVTPRGGVSLTGDADDILCVQE